VQATPVHCTSLSRYNGHRVMQFVLLGGYLWLVVRTIQSKFLVEVM
jgi:hypothetical protein